MKTIIHAVNIEASKADIYKTLTTRKGNSSWWSTSVDSPETIAVGDVIDFTFQEGFNPNMEVIELKGDAYVGWKCVGGSKEWQDNTFSFELTDNEGGGTTLMFTQNYAQELDDKTYGIFNFNWGYYLRSLKEYSETGTGTPFKAK